MNIFEQFESEVRSYCRSYPTVFEYAKNDIMTDENGKKYIDFFCGAGSVNYGHNNDYMKHALIKYLEEDRIIHALDMHTVAKRAFIECFEEKVIKPRDLDYKIQFVGPTGANSVEAAIKLARKVKGRKGIFAFMGAFHGMTVGALALTSDADARKGGGVDLNNVTHIPTPYMLGGFDTIGYMETLMTDDHSGVEKPAAIILETIQTDGGVHVFENEFLVNLEQFCKKHDILLIVDDIQCGCARSGWYFSFERAGINPDIVCMAKSIGGYGMPFALTLMKPEIDKWNPAEHTGTFRGFQMSMIAGKLGLEFMLENKIEEETRRKAEIIREKLSELTKFDDKIEIRGIGLLWGIDVDKFKDISKSIVDTCFKNGLIVERAGRNNNVIKIMPPLTIEDENLVKGLDILINSVKTNIK